MSFTMKHCNSCFWCKSKEFHYSSLICLWHFIHMMPRNMQNCYLNVQCTVMLTALLNSPDPDSHQYTASVYVKWCIWHVDPIIFPQLLQLNRLPFSVNLITLHSVEFPSQLRETGSEEKCCTLSGFTVRDADDLRSENKHNIESNQAKGYFRIKDITEEINL